MPATRYLMMSGVGRSGTTIMRRSIGLHPQVYYNGKENNLVQDVLQAALKNCTTDSRRVAMAVDESKYHQVFREAIEQLIWPDVQMRVDRCLMAAVNLTPDIASFLGDVFPDSKIVGLIRNGIEVVASRMRYPAFAEYEFRSHCETWMRSSKLAQWGDDQDCFRLFRYDWLSDADRTRDELTGMFKWLGLEADPQPADQIFETRFHATDDAGNVTTIELSESDAESRTKLHTERADRWKTWSEQQRIEFKSICGDAMNRLDYEIPW